MKFDLEDMRQFAERHRNRVYTSGPHWSTMARFTLLFDECEKVMKENSILKKRIENLSMSPDHKVRLDAVKHMLEMTAFLRKIMMLGLLRGSPRLRDEALKILDGAELSNSDGSVTQNNTNPDFNNH